MIDIFLCPGETPKTDIRLCNPLLARIHKGTWRPTWRPRRR
jgi:hypothetical protein